MAQSKMTDAIDLSINVLRHDPDGPVSAINWVKRPNSNALACQHFYLKKEKDLNAHRGLHP